MLANDDFSTFNLMIVCGYGQDAGSVLTVIKDIFSFFEDGMTVLIGAAVGSGDVVGAGKLTTLGYIGGLVS